MTANAPVFTNSDGTRRYTFSHAELVAHFMDNRGMERERVSDLITAFVDAGAWDVKVDPLDGTIWYTVNEHARA